MKHIKSYEDFVNENDSINEAKWEVLGSMGDFQVFPDKEKGDHIILILGKGGDQREYPIYLKKRDTADKLRDRYYHGRQINIKESVDNEELNEASIIDRVIITNKLFHKDSNFWVKNKIKFANMINKFMKDSSIGDNDEMILVTLMERGENWTKLDESINIESEISEDVINEGQFSWLTQDTNTQIGSERQNTIWVTMFDDEGRSWQEKGYEGYGEFGGMDYYELLAHMNGYGYDRQAGIDLAFDKIKPKNRRKTVFPALIENPKRFNYKRHDFTEEAEHDPNQSWYAEPEEDEDWY